MGETVAGGIHGGIGLAGGGIIHQRRNRAQRIGCKRSGFRHGIFPDNSQVLLLVLLFIFLPLVPSFAEGLSVHLLELVSEEGAAVGRPVVETDQVLISVFLGQVIDKAGTVKVRVGTHLEIHGGAFRFQAHHREELLSPVDDAAEVHLVITAQGTAHTAAQPGFHKTGNSLVVPAGCIPTGNCKITPKGRDGLGVVHAHLGSEELAPTQIPAVVFVRHHHVRVLVAEKLPVPLARGIHIIRHVQRRHAYLDKGTRQRRHSAVAVVFPVCQQKQRGFGRIDRIGGPNLSMERFTVLVHAHHMWNIPRKVLAKEDQSRIVRFILEISLILSPA